MDSWLVWLLYGVFGLGVAEFSYWKFFDEDWDFGDKFMAKMFSLLMGAEASSVVYGFVMVSDFRLAVLSVFGMVGGLFLLVWVNTLFEKKKKE